MEMEKLIGEFINSLNRRPTTKDTYRKALMEFSKWVGNNSPYNLATSDIQRYKDYILSRNLSSTSMSAYLTAVRRFYDYLQSSGKVKINPAKNVRGGARPRKHLTKALSRKETVRLVDAVDSSSELGRRDKAILTLMARSGLSEIEIVRADVKDLKQRADKTILYVQGKNRDRKDEYVVLHEESIDALNEYMTMRGETGPDEPLLCGIGNRAINARITTRAIRSRISFYFEIAGIDRVGITPYSLRHTAAILAIEEGATPAQVKDMLRLKTLDSTLVYFEEAGRKNGD